MCLSFQLRNYYVNLINSFGLVRSFIRQQTYNQLLESGMNYTSLALVNSWAEDGTSQLLGTLQGPYIICHHKKMARDSFTA